MHASQQFTVPEIVRRRRVTTANSSGLTTRAESGDQSLLGIQLQCLLKRPLPAAPLSRRLQPVSFHDFLGRLWRARKLQRSRPLTPVDDQQELVSLSVCRQTHFQIVAFRQPALKQRLGKRGGLTVGYDIQNHSRFARIQWRRHNTFQPATCRTLCACFPRSPGANAPAQPAVVG